MALFCKKPVVIEAWQWTGGPSRFDARPEWMKTGVVWHMHSDTLSVNTLEGTMVASPDDWIIRGINGEVYPCKPDIFAATYDPVT